MSPSNLDPPNNSGLQSFAFQPLNIILSPETVLMVIWMRDTFEFDKPYEQTESKMQATEKILSNK